MSIFTDNSFKKSLAVLRVEPFFKAIILGDLESTGHLVLRVEPFFKAIILDRSGIRRCHSCGLNHFSKRLYYFIILQYDFVRCGLNHFSKRLYWAARSWPDGRGCGLNHFSKRLYWTAPVYAAATVAG